MTARPNDPSGTRHPPDPPTRRCGALLFDRDQHGYTGMNSRQTTIKRRDVSVSAAGKVTEICVSDLSVTDESNDDVVRER